jgi:hypothetical protein
MEESKAKENGALVDAVQGAVLEILADKGEPVMIGRLKAAVLRKAPDLTEETGAGQKDIIQTMTTTFFKNGPWDFDEKEQSVSLAA